MKIIGYTSYMDNSFIPNRFWSADYEDSLTEEANTQILSKLEDREPEYDENLMDIFWNAEGDFKKELENLFREIAITHLTQSTTNNHTKLIDTKKHLDQWLKESINKEKQLILENNTFF